MGRRPHVLLLGAMALAAVIGTAHTASSQPARPSVVRADVAATGQPIGPADGWHVERQAPGVYRVVVTDRRVTLDVPTWDDVADVTVLPQGDGTNIVRFARRGRAVDTGFTFVAVARR